MRPSKFGGVVRIHKPVHGPLAQWLEQAPHKRLVVGSNPTRAIILTKRYIMLIKLKQVEYVDIGYPNVKNYQKVVSDIFVNPDFVISVRGAKDSSNGDTYDLTSYVELAGSDTIKAEGAAHHVANIISGKV